MADWVTISSLATAGGTLTLAVATFSSIKSAKRSARVAERALLAGLRPLLIPSREEDSPERVRFGEGQVLIVPGHGAAIEIAQDNVYMAIALRNGGTGLAVIHGWRVEPRQSRESRHSWESRESRQGSNLQAPALDDFRRQLRDLYIPAGDTGFWQGAVRDRDDPDYPALRDAYAKLQSVAENEAVVMVDLLYGDHEGGQRTITRFVISAWPDVDGERAEVIRYWNVDRDDPR